MLILRAKFRSLADSKRILYLRIEGYDLLYNMIAAMIKRFADARMATILIVVTIDMYAFHRRILLIIAHVNRTKKKRNPYALLGAHERLVFWARSEYDLQSNDDNAPPNNSSQ